MNILPVLLVASLICLAGCGSSSPSSHAGSFAGTTAGGSSASGSSVGVASVALDSVQLTGGAQTTITVNLTQPAPSGGITVQLQSSDASIASLPSTLTVPAGATSASAAVPTSAVTAATSVSLTASYEGTLAGASLHVSAPSTTEFTLAVSPSTVTVADGKSGTSKATTTIAKGYDHALTLSATNVPSGVSVTFKPATISAPGSGSSTVDVAVSSSVAAGTYSIKLSATDGKNTSSATLTLKVSASNPGATFKGCWYKSGGKSYQGVTVGVQNPGTYPFNALLYSDEKCTTYADQFGYGQEINFGGFDYIFWFDHFPNQENMSALWYVGSDTSQCLVYTTSTPSCN
jgi:hypothetical protein